MRTTLLLFVTLLALIAAAVWSPFSTAGGDADVTGDFGEPIPGLAPHEQLRFENGREVFARRFERQDGLGPHFNATSCMSCHEDPVVGGSSQRYRDFFLVMKRSLDGPPVKTHPDCTTENRDRQDDELCLPSPVMPHYGPLGSVAAPVAASVEHPPIPPEATVRANRNAPPIFGIGLFRLVSDEEILSREDPDDADGDGISGRANRIPTEDHAIGRFGYKCQTASIEAFNRGALNNQMGITSDSIDLASGATPESGPRSLWDELTSTSVAHAQVAEPRDRIIDFDGVPDPEISRFQLMDLVFFQENLAAPKRGRITKSVLRGEKLFEEIGCTGCHVPSLTIPQGTIHPYTDLLVHDMGPELADGVEMVGASGSEFRTQPLWGLCEHRPFLHDGRADTVEQAVLLHGGEARASRDAFEALAPSAKSDVLRFLESL